MSGSEPFDDDDVDWNPDFDLIPTQAITGSYDDRMIALKQYADAKFKGQKLRREAKKFAIFCLELSIAWAIVTVWLWLGVTLFLTKFNALDHLIGIGPLDWVEMGALGTCFMFVM